jgi:tetratricopeptide (TPR) repeat protein
MTAETTEAKKPETPAAKKPEKADVFKNSVIVLLTLVSIFAAIITFLQNYASLLAENYVQQSEFKAVEATGDYFRVGLEAAQGLALQENHADYIQRAVRADTKARALRLGGYPDLAREYDLDARRWREAAVELQAEMDAQYPLLADYGDSVDVYREILSHDAYLKNEQQYVLLAKSRAWSNKANGLVAVLSTLSVALFLGGLSLTIGSRVRLLLGASSVALAGICILWMLGILVSPAPDIPDEALEHFVNGQIKLNIADFRGEDAVDAIPDFDQAIDLAPDYARAYVFRSFANTDSSLTDLHLNVSQAIADMEKAIRLGDESNTALVNLGWLYYLNGQYNNALRTTVQAVNNEDEECFAEFNWGLTLLALKREDEAKEAYRIAIECADRQEDKSWTTYYLDVGVLDLEDLRAARPDLEATLEESIRRLKSAAATLTMFESLTPAATDALLTELTFGEDVDENNAIVTPADEYSQGIQTVYASLGYENMTPDTRWLERWLRDGQETLVINHDFWDGDESGTWWIGIYNSGGLTSGEYEVDVFVEGNLLTSGRFTILPGDLPPMTSQESTDVGVTINYPADWNVTDLADNEVSVVAARDPNSQDFFGVTAWLATTGSDDDIFDLFDLNFDALEGRYADVERYDPEAFTVDGHDGWLSYYSYTNDEGLPIYGAVVGVQNFDRDTTFMLMVETHSDEWDGKVDLINVMLSRMEINK